MTRTAVVRDEPSPHERVSAGAVRRRRRTGGPVADVVAVLGVFAVLGLVCGVLWWLVVEPAEFTKGRGGGTMGEVELAKRFNADGWYTVLAVVPGFVAGVLVTWWRDRDFRLTTVLLVPGAALAAALTAVVGRVLGPGDPDAALDAAAVGVKVPEQLVVTGHAVYLTWPIAVLFGALVVLWSSPVDPPARSRTDPDGPHRG